ncbi:MAG: hypothetical protein AAF682_10240 [Planctomycetota bacterium]
MNRTLIISSLALVVSFAGAATSLLRGSGQQTAPTQAAAIRPEVDFGARLDALVDENRALRKRLDALELRPAAAPAAERTPVLTGLAKTEELDALRQELLQALEQRPALDAALLSEPEMKDQLAETLAEIRHEEAVEGVLRYQEKRLEALEETMGKVNGWLELTPAQSTSMRAALLAGYERGEEVTERWRAGDSDEVLGQLKADNRELLIEELSGFLSPTQLEAFVESGWDGG